jgi:type IV secretory pathway TraG/TraD family ATPase VirD4
MHHLFDATPHGHVRHVAEAIHQTVPSLIGAAAPGSVDYSAFYPAIGVGLAAAVIAGAGYSIHQRGLGRSMPKVSLWRKLRLRWHPGPGFASRYELWRRYGLQRCRKVARRARPTLSRRERYGRGAWREYATFLGWGQGWLHRWRCYASFNEIVLTIAAPQKGKSAMSAGRIIDAPGALAAISIRGDLIANTAGLREKVGKIHVWNPEGVGRYGSTFQWNPVQGCHDMQTAVRRAGYMVEAVEATGTDDPTFWENQACMVLASYLHAAALAGQTLTTVYEWINTYSEEPAEILETYDMAAPFSARQLRRFLNFADRTRDSVEATLANVLRFMTVPEIVEMLEPGPGEGLDLVEFVQSKDTLYLVASAEGHSPIPPLFTAFLAELKVAAQWVGSNTTAGRLDPPLTMELDEVANVAPIPVSAWASYAAGAGIRLNIYAQSWAQLVDRWGREGAATIWQTAACKMIFTGTSETDLLQMVEKACGKVRLRTHTEYQYDARGKRHPQHRYERVDVLPASEARMIPPGRAIVILDAGRPTILRTEAVWNRRDFKEWAKSGKQVMLPAPKARPGQYVQQGSLTGHTDPAEVVELFGPRQERKQTRRAQEGAWTQGERGRAHNSGPSAPPSFGGARPVGSGPRRHRDAPPLIRPAASGETGDGGGLRPAPEPRPRMPWDPPEREA